MNSITLYKRIVERYGRYLETTFYFKDPELRRSFRKALMEGHFSKGPYLEATPTFRRGKKAGALFVELLTKTPDEGFLKALLGDRTLYLHQEEAICKVFWEENNVVVATGTASGKTEAFLYPILLHLYKEFQAGQLAPGIRALILYPMNALANDQRERLGEIRKELQNAKSKFSFTFGQYIGETPEDENDSYRHAQDHITDRLPGELVLRKEMRKNPPHILLTNYSMLEYLLIRPYDSPLFDNGRASWWNFIVLDEAHQYRGAKGIEMGMLIRRLKSRLKEGGCSKSLRCIATSATIGGKHDRAAVACFASDLFGEQFMEENVIIGKTEPIIDSSTTTLTSTDYSVLRQALDSYSPINLHTIAHRIDVKIPKELEVSKAVGLILQHDSCSTKIRCSISEEVKQVSELASELFPDLSEDASISTLSELVDVIVRAQDPYSSTPLLSARYHFFLRSLQGAYLSYIPQKCVYLERQVPGHKEALFEVALCRECGQHYLVGRFKDGVLKEAIRDPGQPDFGATFFRPIEETDTMTTMDNSRTKRRLFNLCVECGSMSIVGEGESVPACPHSTTILVEEQEGAKEKEDQIPKCSACGYRAPDPVREVIHGTDGPHAVIATTLHQALPDKRKKVLAFADGRQEAAFFAWYLENSYKNILNRNLILKAAKSLGNDVTEGISLRDWAPVLRNVYRQNKVFPPAMGEVELRRKAWIRLYREFLTDEPRISLEGVGLLRWYVKWPEGFKVPELLLNSPWNLDEQDARDLIFLLLDCMRADRAVELLTTGNVQLSWDDLGIQAAKMRVRIGLPRGQRGVRSWDGATGRRVQLLVKLLTKKGLSKQDAVLKAKEVLRHIWEAIRKTDESMPSQHCFLLSDRDARRLNPDWWRAFVVHDDDALYQCNTCARLQSMKFSGVCTRHRCPGTVLKFTAKELGVNHYRLLYKEDLPGALRVEEHTAQIDREKAREFQRAFKKGEIHVLSSSTTFELGVDLGDLDTIFLRNVPPETFNYAQRVGRAGRRSGFPGFAITYCRRNPHDLYHYADPGTRILKGTIRPPIISLRNKKIISRHIVATVLSYFFIQFPDRFKNVEKLLVDIEQPSGVRDFFNFLQKQRTELEELLKDIIPQTMLNKVGLSSREWIEHIVGKDSRFVDAEAEVSNDYRLAKGLETRSAKKGDYDTAKWARGHATRIADEDVLSFLSRKAVVPKYGFPVDVVELDTHRTQQTFESLKVLLQRDLSIAIAEFAPTSKLVANKKEWTSYGLKKVAGKEWECRYYRRCTKHNLFLSWKLGEAEPTEICCSSVKKGCYLLPRFGFVTDRHKPKEPRGRSHRVFTTRPYFLGLTGSHPGDVDFGGVKLTKASPGLMVVLCEGRQGKGFFICRRCGAGFRERMNQHKTPIGEDCSGSLSRFSLGHEFETDVLRLEFLSNVPEIDILPVWLAYSLAYALVEGSADTLEVPSKDLSATVVYASDKKIPPIILYDNVPGGAGLVARLEDKTVLYDCLSAALVRVDGDCGCGENDSCYGCLRSYRNQFAHQHLQRGPVKKYLKMILQNS